LTARAAATINRPLCAAELARMANSLSG
jgi:hypothetical protein